MKTGLLTALALLLAIGSGCEISHDSSSDDGTYFSESGNASEPAASSDGSTPAPVTEAPADAGDVDLGNTTWLHTDVSGWAVTSSLSVSISGGTINLKYDKANVWPEVDGVNANPWIFVYRDGRWYAATWEWLRGGQTSKPTAVVNGAHIKRSPLNDFKPVSGETYGFMVSGLARDKSKRNVSERTPIVMRRWP